MPLNIGAELTPDQSSAGGIVPNGTVGTGLNIGAELFKQPTTSAFQLPQALEPTAGLLENAANQITQLGVMASEVPNALGSIGGELVDSIANQHLPSIDNIAQRMEAGHQLQSNFIYQPKTESGQSQLETVHEVFTSIPKAVDALDDLSGSKLKSNFPNLYGAIQASGELLPWMVLGKGIHEAAGKVDNPLLKGEDLDLESARLSVRPGPKVGSVEVERTPITADDLGEVKSVEVPQIDSELASRMAELVSSPTLSIVEEASQMVGRIDEITKRLEGQDLTPEAQAELGSLYKERTRLEARYKTLSAEFQGESSVLPDEQKPSEQTPEVNIPNVNDNLVPDPEIARGLEDHFSPDAPKDNLVYSSPKLLAHGNLVEDLLISSGVRSKVALLDLSDIEANPELKGALGGELETAYERLKTTNNYGVVKQVKTEHGSKWIALVNSAEISKGKGAAGPRIIEAALHEAFGHVVVGEKYAWASEEVKGALQKDFQRFSKLSGDEATRAFYPLKTGEIAIGVPEMADGTAFKEWLVNGIVKWATTNKEPVGLANKWFSKVADTFKKAYVKLAGREADVTPASIKEWMESIFDSKRLLEGDVKEAAPVQEVIVHSPTKKVSLTKQLAMLKAAVSPEELSRYEVGKVEGQGDNVIAVYQKRPVYATDSNGVKSLKRVDKIHLNTFKSTSRSTVRREAELFRYAHALATRGFEEQSPRSARFDYYRGLLGEVQRSGVLKEIASDRGTTAEQVWLDFLADPQSFVTFSQEALHRFARLDEAEGRLFDKVVKAIERDDSAVKRAILVERRVIPEEIQELQKAEPVLAEESGSEPKPQNHIGTYKDYTLSGVYDPTREELRVQATDKEGNVVGKASAGELWRNVFVPDNVGVDAMHQRKGVASAMYDAMQQIVPEGGKIDYRRADVLTDEGKAFRDRYDKRRGNSGNFITHEMTSAPYAAELKISQEQKPVTVPIMNDNFESRIRSASQETIANLMKVGSKVNLERIEGSVKEKLRLEGKDWRDARKWIKDNYEDLKAGKVSVENEIQDRLAEQKVPDDVSLDEASAYMDLLGDMAVVRSLDTARKTKELLKKIEEGGGLYAGEAYALTEDGSIIDKYGRTLETNKDAERRLGRMRFYADKLVGATLRKDLEVFSPDYTTSEILKVGTKLSFEDLQKLEDSGVEPEAIYKNYTYTGVQPEEYLDMAVRRRKVTKITGPLYEKVIKEKRAKKDLPEEEINKRQQKRLEKEKEFVAGTAELEAKADAANLSLTEYLRTTGLAEDQVAKILRKYIRLAKTRFTDTEHILRLGKELGLVDGEHGVQGLEAYIKSIFPKAQGPLSQLTITGRDILIHKMQEAYLKQTGDKFDFATVPTLRELRNLQFEALRNASRWEKFRAGLAYYTGRAMDELQVTPSGAALVQLIKNVQTTEASLYTREYMKRLDELGKAVTDAGDREHILNVYMGLEAPRNKVFADGAKLLDEIYTSYGQEMERIGVRTIYKGGYQSKFTFDPTQKHFPHMWEPGSFDKPSQAMLDSLTVSGMKPDARQARAIIAQYGRRYSRLSAPRFANLELAREIEMEGWIKDPIKVTTMYVQRSAKRLAILREVGQSPETRLAQLAWDHYQQTKDPDSLNFAVKVINATTGVSTHEPLMHKALNFVGAAEFLAMASALQHAALIQPSVVSNVIATAGLKNTVKGFYRYWKSDPRKASMGSAWADSLGASSRSIARELLDEIHDGNSLQSRADKLLSFWKVTSVDRVTRDASTLVGQLYVNDMIERSVNLGDKKAEVSLKRLGLDINKVKLALESKDDAMLEDLLRKGSYEFSQVTNLATTTLTMPTMMYERTSYGRLLTLFGRFAFHQHHFLKDTIKENPAKFGKYLLASGAVGVPIYLARTLAKGVNPADDFEQRGLFGTAMAVLQSGGGLGLFADAGIEALTVAAGKPSNQLQGRLGGPLGGIGVETVQGVGKIAQGEITNAKALRTLLRAGTVALAGLAPEKWGVPAAAVLGLGRPMIERALSDKSK